MLGIFPKSVKIGLKALSFKPTHLVPETGLEPVRCCHHGILSPGRLPVPPLGQIKKPNILSRY